MSSRYDVITIGVGGVGSAAVYHLADHGLDVLGLEQFGIPHQQGSSHGITRSLSLTKARGPSYVPIAMRAYDLWQDLETESGDDLFFPTGHVRAWPGGGGGHRGTIEDALEGCRAHSLDHETLTGAELNERFPGFDLPADHDVIYQPDGGYLDPEACITAHVQQAQARGAEIRAQEPVRRWEPSGDGVRVETSKGEYEADRLVVTTGAWASKFLDVLADVLVPERRVMVWLQPTDMVKYQPSNFPVFSIDVDEGYYYGSPIHRVPGFKFGRRPRIREAVDPDSMQRAATPQDEEILRRFAEEYLPEGAGPTMRIQTCIVTFSPDSGFLIDSHPDYPQVTFGAGFSGSGFHVSSAVGELLADLATETDPRVDPSPFRLDRLGGS